MPIDGMPRFSVGSVDLSQDEIDWFQVACNLSGESVRSKTGQIVRGHLWRFKQHYIRQVDYIARSHDLTWEQAFVLLKKASPPFKPEDIEAARQATPLAIRQEEEKALQLGKESPPQETYKGDPK